MPSPPSLQTPPGSRRLSVGDLLDLYDLTAHGVAPWRLADPHPSRGAQPSHPPQSASTKAPPPGAWGPPHTWTPPSPGPGQAQVPPRAVLTPSTTSQEQRSVSPPAKLMPPPWRRPQKVVTLTPPPSKVPPPKPSPAKRTSSRPPSGRKDSPKRSYSGYSASAPASGSAGPYTPCVEPCPATKQYRDQRYYDRDANTWVYRDSTHDRWRQSPYERANHTMSNNLPDDVDPYSSRYNAGATLALHLKRAHPSTCSTA